MLLLYKCIKISILLFFAGLSAEDTTLKDSEKLALATAQISSFALGLYNISLSFESWDQYKQDMKDIKKRSKYVTYDIRRLRTNAQRNFRSALTSSALGWLSLTAGVLAIGLLGTNLETKKLE